MTSLMRRGGSNLQHRGKSTQPDSRNEDEDASNHDEEEDEFHDSKDARLTLMEEVLLLGLKEKEVCLGLSIHIKHCRTFIPRHLHF